MQRCAISKQLSEHLYITKSLAVHGRHQDRLTCKDSSYSSDSKLFWPSHRLPTLSIRHASMRTCCCLQAILQAPATTVLLPSLATGPRMDQGRVVVR